MSARITISGFEEFENKARKLPAELLQDFDEAAGFAAADWELKAKRDAPKDIGFLAGGISHKHNKEGEWEVISASEYSAYMEWGTRLKARVPAELSAYASQFKGGTGGGDPKKFIFAWAKRKGIDPEYWYPIFISIMRTGVNPHPYFFPQKPIVEVQFIKDLQQIINTER